MSVKQSQPSGSSLAIGSAIGSGTSGSVLFVDSSGNLAQDNSKLFWDDSNNRLGIGTNSPTSTLHAKGRSNFFDATPLGAESGISIKTYNSNTGGYSVMEIAGSNDSQWTTGEGIRFNNHISTILVGSPFICESSFAAQTPWLGASNVNVAEDALIVTAGSGRIDLESLLYASSPYPDVYLSCPSFTVNTKTSTAWPDGGVGGSYGTARFYIKGSGEVGINNTNPGSQLQVDTSSSSTIGQIIKGSASQSVDLLQLQNSSGTVLTNIDENGHIEMNNTATTPHIWGSSAQGLGIGYGGNSLLTFLGSGANFTTPVNVANTAIDAPTGKFYQYPTFTANIFEIGITSGATLFAVGAANGTPTTRFTMRSGTAGSIGLVVKGESAQSANLQEWQNSSAGILSSIDASGIPTFGLASVQNGTIKLNGSTSGTATITVPVAAGTPTLTLPSATGTLATLAGTEEFDNKTLDSSVGKGTWTASGTWTLPAITLGGNATLDENVSIVLDPALSADGKYCGITEAGTAGTTLAFGDVVYLAAADSRWELADASAASTSGDVKVGICVLAAAADGSATTILLYGKVRADAVFPSFTISAPIYISETAGDLTNTAPTTTDSVSRRMGFANTADEIFFNPSNDYYTHT